MGRCLLLFFAFWGLFLNIHGFNIDTEQFLTFNEPLGQNSMFGYSISLYQNNTLGKIETAIIVGAPNFNGIGTAYICEMEKKTCKNFGNFDSTQKGQMLGATVVSNKKGEVVICAPKFHTNNYYPIGKCYSFKLRSNSPNPEKSCENRNKTFGDGGYCLAGLSAAISNNGIYYGTPGSVAHKGGCITPQSQSTCEFRPYQIYYLYAGYSMTYGTFIYNQEFIALGVPRENNIGSVKIHETPHMRQLNYDYILGEQYGEYFGYSLATVDVDGDMKDDLLVSAPMYTRENIENGYETGRVYIFRQVNGYQSPYKITGYESQSRFGTSMCSLGDINNDKYNDFAISAPYAGSGKVYIYHGSNNLQDEMKYSQVLEPEETVGKLPVSAFGFSLSGNTDVDGNGYPDIAVGAYESNQVFVYKARPIVDVKGEVSNSGPISLKNLKCVESTHNLTCTTVRACFVYSGKKVPKTLLFNITWTMDVDRASHRSSRVLTTELKDTYHHIWSLNTNVKHCREINVFKIEEGFWGYEPDIKLKIDYNLVSNKSSNELQPILKPKPPIPPITILIEQDCENECFSDLQVNASTISTYIYGDTTNIEVSVEIQNNGSDSFDTTFRMTIPPGFMYQSYKHIQGQRLVCSSESTFENEILTCDLANPFRKNDGLTVFNVILTHIKDQLRSANYMLSMTVNASNSERNETLDDNTIVKEIQIISDVKLTMYGKGVPNDEILYEPKDMLYPEINASEALIGPQVVHTYSFENTGLTTIEQAEAYVVWPFSIDKHYFLYLLEDPTTSSNVVCEKTNLINVASVQINEKHSQQQNDENEMQAELTDDNTERAKRDLLAEQQNNLKNRLTCPNFDCENLKCTINSLESGKIVQISLRFRIVVKTLQKLTNFSAMTSTDCTTNITKLPLNMTSTHEMVIQEIRSTFKPVPIDHSIPKLWTIILSADAGTLILLGMIVFLWKRGFFKRQKLPTDENNSTEKSKRGIEHVKKN